MAIQPRIGINATFSVGTTSTQLAPKTSTRQQIVIRNRGTVSVYVGFSGPATSDGYELLPDEELSVSTEEAVSAIAASGTAAVKVLEEVRS